MFSLDENPYGTLFDEDTPYITLEDDYSDSYWDVGFGLQKIDGIEPSDQLKKLAKQQVNNGISYEEIEKELYQYYSDNEKADISKMEADFSSLRIAELLSSNSFTFSPGTLIGYHKYIFSGIDSFEYPVGEFRKTNISKKQCVLNGESVIYSDFRMIKDTINWDFMEEKSKDYSAMNRKDAAHEVMDFISKIWQIHPFREGNTRAVSTFAIKYFINLGFDVNNTPFKDHAHYFRNALVLANAPKKLGGTDKYLKMFTENVMLGGNNELKIKIKKKQ